MEIAQIALSLGLCRSHPLFIMKDLEPFFPFLETITDGHPVLKERLPQRGYKSWRA